MDWEAFFSGYCRQIDAPRRVCAEFYDGTLIVDCCFDTCPYTPQCPIAQGIADKQNT